MTEQPDPLDDIRMYGQPIIDRLDNHSRGTKSAISDATMTSSVQDIRNKAHDTFPFPRFCRKYAPVYCVTKCSYCGGRR
jgi:hypothetical protein